MKKILYLTNCEAPYRVRMFNELAKYCNLTVVYERKKSSNRNADWTASETKNYDARYLRGIKLKRESSFSLGIVKYIFSKPDYIIVGCYNSPIQMFAILLMKLFRIPYIVNLDGEPFLTGKGLKTKLKKFFLFGANKYLVAGKMATNKLKKIIKNKECFSYGFTSLSEKELRAHSCIKNERNNTVLVVGQYFDYKGLDVALNAARKDESIQYKFVGMGNRTDLFIKQQKTDELANVEVVSFLSKDELEKEYQKCAMLVLPSRQECWGLVINEAASFGTPIVSTWGSGAAVEFLSGRYSRYLAKAGDIDDLYQRIKGLFNEKDINEYGEYLINKSAEYSLEKSVDAHLKALKISKGN